MEKQPLILAVDDQELVLKLLRVNLSLEGYHVVTASNGMSPSTAIVLREHREQQAQLRQSVG
ncbi:unnamed protein product, partial [marine sediment metagenome]